MKFKIRRNDDQMKRVLEETSIRAKQLEQNELEEKSLDEPIGIQVIFNEIKRPLGGITKKILKT